jgi:crotonobetainyl-CoA:carnitine CoA-transferase CaiB-like acyl-CoA transferase
MMRLIVPDKITALTSAQAISTALVQKYRTGKGTHINLSMVDAVVSFEWAEAFARETFIMPSESIPEREYTRDMVFETKDGKFIAAGAVQDKEWIGMSAALDKPEWLTQERFKTAAARNINRAERLDAQAEEIKKFDSEDIMARMNKHQVPNGPVNHPREKVLEDPQVVHNDLIFRTKHPNAPFMLRQPRPAAQFSSSPFELSRHAPLLGQHTREVLLSLGISDEEVDQLMREKVVHEAVAKIADPTKTDARKLGVTSG